MPRHNILSQEYIKAASTPTITGCWRWSGSTDSSGYGIACFDGKRIGAHRASFLAFKGSLQDGQIVMHKCDVPACVNPKHLFAGTHKLNAEDSANKKRRGGQKLSPSDVASIRSIYKSGKESQYALARKFNVTQSNISRIISHETFNFTR